MDEASTVPITEELEKITSKPEEKEYKKGQDFYLKSCGHIGKIIKVYDNGNIAVRCSQSHEKDPLRGDAYKGKFKIPIKSGFWFRHTSVTKPVSKRNLVYIIDPR